MPESKGPGLQGFLTRERIVSYKVFGTSVFFRPWRHMSYISFLSWVPKQDSLRRCVSKLVSESGGNVQIGSLPNMERFHLGSSTAGSLEAQLRAGKPTCTGMPLSDHLTENEVAHVQPQKSGCQPLANSTLAHLANQLP